jgi:hypothetical protein
MRWIFCLRENFKERQQNIFWTSVRIDLIVSLPCTSSKRPHSEVCEQMFQIKFCWSGGFGTCKENDGWGRIDVEWRDNHERIEFHQQILELSWLVKIFNDVLIVSSTCLDSTHMHAIKTVLALPPNESFRTFVSFVWRYGMWFRDLLVSATTHCCQYQSLHWAAESPCPSSCFNITFIF